MEISLAQDILTVLPHNFGHRASAAELIIYARSTILRADVIWWVKYSVTASSRASLVCWRKALLEATCISSWTGV